MGFATDDEVALGETRPLDDTGGDSSTPSVRVRTEHPLTIDGRYDVKGVLGEGAMGVVYRARESLLDRDVAIKMISPQWSDDAAFADGFIREAQAMAKIRHPNVAHVYTFGKHQAAWYLAMELVRGASLADILSAHRQRGEVMSIHNAITIMSEVIAGVGAIHEAGLLHCDLKPGNIVVERDTGRPVIIDFGVATAMRSATTPLAGSPAYMSPEQHDESKERLTERGDIYALGCTAFELLTGHLPYRAATYSKIVRAHRESRIPRPSSVRPEVEAFDDVVMRAMAKKPEGRFQTCAEMFAALERARQSWNLNLDPPSVPELMPESHADERLLVVDDDPWFRNAAARAAELSFGARTVQVYRASSGAEALSITAQRMPTVILLDYMLPGLDGVGTLSAIRALPGGRDAQVIVVSGSVAEAKWRFAALGVADFLVKPVELDELIATIGRAVSRAAARG